MDIYLIIAGIVVGVYLILGLFTSVIFYKNMPESYHREVPSWFKVRKTEILIEVLFFPMLWFGIIYKHFNKDSSDE
jgi:4-hydroxybenzoate polyprenyltransferase